MTRGVLAGALVGVVQGLVAVLLVSVLGSGPDDFGWFAYTPLEPGDTVVVPGPPSVVQEWLLVPLVLAVLGAVAGGFSSRGAARRGDRGVLVAGTAGLVLAVVTVALAARAREVGSTLVLLGASTMPQRYADYLPLESAQPSVAPAVLLVAGSVLGALALVAVSGLARGRRWGWIGTTVTLVLGLVGLGVQLFRTGLAPITLLGEVVALVLVAAALVLSRRPRAAQAPPTRP